MMDVTPLIPKGRKIIQAYGDGGFTVSGERHDGSIIITPEAVSPLTINTFENLFDISALKEIMDLKQKIEILLVGCGASAQFLPRHIERTLRGCGIVADVMDTGAACRTYNVLLAEERLIAAALIA